MNHPISLTRKQAREIDERAVRDFGMPSLLLMENAGRGLADLVVRLCPAGPVVICCGKGNNGGDGFVLARHLQLRRVPMRVALWADPASLTGDAATNWQILTKCNVSTELFYQPNQLNQRGDSERLAELLNGAKLIVDALLGTGATGEPRPPLDTVIDELNAHSAMRLAVDLPSGLDADTGQPARHTIRAAHTATFVAPKVGMLTPEATPFVGQIHTLDIGAPWPVIEAVLRDDPR